MITYNVLRNVCEYDRHGEWHGQGHCNLCEAMKTAAAAFAAINGWQITASRSRTLDDLSKAARAPFKGVYNVHDPDYRLLDHVQWFKSVACNVAVAGQPYAYGADDIDREHARLRERGLVLHVPPDPLASLHNPGNATFVVITKPDVTVRWLPEQDGSMATVWGILNDAAQQRDEATEARRRARARA